MGSERRSSDERGIFRRSGIPLRGQVTRSSGVERNVFVIHGRDDQLRERIFQLLRSVDLRPLEWEALVTATRSTSPSLLAVVQTALEHAQAVVVLLAPEDVVCLHPSLYEKYEGTAESSMMMQPRPNVLIELGMALMKCPDRTIILEFGDLRPIADLGGLNVIRFDGGTSAIGKLIQRLKVAGCHVDDSGADWRGHRKSGDFDANARRPHIGILDS